jgi:hypothetical protein
MLEKQIKSKVSPRLFPGYTEPGSKAKESAAFQAYDLLSRVITSLALNYLVCPFQALSWDRSMAAWSSLYFCGHIACVALLVLLAAVPPVKSGSRKGPAGAAPPPAAASSEKPAPSSAKRASSAKGAAASS